MVVPEGGCDYSMYPQLQVCLRGCVYVWLCATCVCGHLQLICHTYLIYFTNLTHSHLFSLIAHAARHEAMQSGHDAEVKPLTNLEPSTPHTRTHTAHSRELHINEHPNNQKLNFRGLGGEVSSLGVMPEKSGCYPEHTSYTNWRFRFAIRRLLRKTTRLKGKLKQKSRRYWRWRNEGEKQGKQTSFDIHEFIHKLLVPVQS